jgi:adenine-specific DNA methylase
MNFMHNESSEKLRGGYYTPPDLATFLAQWVAQIHPETLLEPSCGDGVFLSAIADAGLQASCTIAVELDGIEASKAVTRADALRMNARILNRDFLGWALAQMRSKNASVDAVVGNPPFVRYQYLPESFQISSEQVFAALGCRFTKHTNAWVPFILASLALLRPGGRLAMVVPSEILHVLHAQSLRSFLIENCRKVVLIDPEELWFQDTLQGAVLLMAEKKTHPSNVSEGLGLVPVRGRAFLRDDPASIFDRATPLSGKAIEAKWTRAFLSQDTRHLLEEVEELGDVRRFSEVASVDVGIVTGANKFFLVEDAVIERFNLQSWAHPMFGRSEHCPGVVYDKKQHKANKDAGLPANFLWFPDDNAVSDPAVAAYIRHGEELELHKRYKCRIRQNWYSVPSVASSPVGMLKRSHDAPKLIRNSAKAYTTDTAYRVRAKRMSADALVVNFINPLTALSAELEGRTYGGGVLELVPSEIERLLVPSLKTPAVDMAALDKTVRSQGMSKALATHGVEVLKAVGVKASQRSALLDAWKKLRSRRQRNTDHGDLVDLD